MILTLGRLASLRCSTASASSSLSYSTSVTCTTMPARSLAASTPELQPPLPPPHFTLTTGPPQCGPQATPPLLSTSVVSAEVMILTLGRLASLRCSTASARSSLSYSTSVTCATMPARSIAASTPELPPPITATRLPL